MKHNWSTITSQPKIQTLLDQFLAAPFPHNSEGTNLEVDKLNRIFEVSATLSNLKTTKRKPKDNLPLRNGLTMTAENLDKN